MLTISTHVASYVFVAVSAFWAGTHVPANESAWVRMSADIAMPILGGQEGKSSAALSETEAEAEAIRTSLERAPKWEDMNVDGLSITQVAVSRAASEDNSFRYDVTIENKGRRFIGNMEILVAGKTPAGVMKRTSTESAEANLSAGAELMSVARYLRASGKFSVPANISPRMIFVKLLEHGEIRASKVIWVQAENLS